jgi:thymidylate synthase
MKHHDHQYLNLVSTVLNTGVRKPNRTGVDTISVFGPQMKFDLRDGTIPLLTTKKMFTRGIIREILWYLMGSDNIAYLKEHNVTIWDEWAREDGGLGPVYGYQWRKWPAPYKVESDWPEQQLPSGEPHYQIRHIDQIAQLIKKLKTNPDDRRMLVTAWNVADLADMALPPCHYSFQCYTRPLALPERARMFLERTGTFPGDLLDGELEEQHQIFDQVLVPRHELSMLLNQRSCDVGLGVPFNIVQYSILLRMFAHVCNMTPGDFIWNGGDVHIYENHINALTSQLEREPFASPKFHFARDINSIDGFKFEDFIIEEYETHPTIKMDVAV